VIAGKSSIDYPNVFFFPMVLRPNASHGLLILEVSKSHITIYHSRYDSSGRVISSLQRSITDNTQHLQQINIYVPVGIRNHNLSRWAAADLRLRPRGRWVQPTLYYMLKSTFMFTHNHHIHIISDTSRSTVVTYRSSY